jgi:hypothetical protein
MRIRSKLCSTGVQIDLICTNIGVRQLDIESGHEYAYFVVLFLQRKNVGLSIDIFKIRSSIASGTMMTGPPLLLVSKSRLQDE